MRPAPIGSFRATQQTGIAGNRVPVMEFTMHRLILSASLVAGTMAGLGMQIGTAQAAHSLSCSGARYCQPFIQACRQIRGELNQWMDANGGWLEYTCSVADVGDASRLAPLVSTVPPPRREDGDDDGGGNDPNGGGGSTVGDPGGGGSTVGNPGDGGSTLDSPGSDDD